MFEFLRGLILGLRQEHATIVGLVIDEVDHVAIAVPVCRCDWAF
jgi:hypothetical protein